MQPFTGGWNRATHFAMASTDYMHLPVIMDPEGRQMPIVHYTSNGECYVIKEIVEHIIVPPPAPRLLVSEYSYGSEEPRKVEYIHLDSAFGRPERVEELITRVLTEASRGPTRPVAVPLTSAWHCVPNRVVQENTRKYGDERDFRGHDRKKLNGSPNWDIRNEPYLNAKGANTHNRDAYDLYEGPRVNEGSTARNHPLSKPTNDIGTGMEFLKEAVKPSYGNGKEKIFNTNAQTEASRPPAKPVPLSSMPWRTGSNLSVPETKVESDDDDSEEEEESQYVRHGEREPVKNRGGAKPIENKDAYENPKGNGSAVQFGQTRFPVSTMPKKEQNSYPEKIDSREAGRRYGKSSSRAMEEEAYKGTINSREAMLKYNGAFIPR